ncbi:MAG: electron transfer flavoprotein subunit beta/FixA family protein [Synergistaceae bacterium]|jgi:electron transfer flavoprotein beta subunit|nr:electron transfer flavoprotein subunit beta/FixA family protein [Synergistaceae bacterium]
MSIVALVKLVAELKNTPFETPRGSVRLTNGGFNGGFAMNPTDACALETALRLKRRYGEVTVFTMGPPAAREVLQQCYAVGADHCIHLCDSQFAGSDTLATARVIAAAIRRLKAVDLVLCGRRTSDSETGHIPAQLSVLLEIPCVPDVTAVETKGGNLLVTALSEAGTRQFSIKPPALLAVCDNVDIPRLPTIQGLRLARAKEARQWDNTILRLDPNEVGTEGSCTAVVGMEKIVLPLRRLHLRTDVDDLLEDVLTYAHSSKAGKNS